MNDATPYVNDLATRSFRNVADQDYIAARLCFRGALMVQFSWMAHQTIEKYLKAILIYNGQSSKGLSHDLSKALGRIEVQGKLPLSISPPVRKFISYLDDQGPNRSSVSPFFSHNDRKLMKLRHKQGTCNEIGAFNQVQ